MARVQSIKSSEFKSSKIKKLKIKSSNFKSTKVKTSKIKSSKVKYTPAFLLDKTVQESKFIFHKETQYEDDRMFEPFRQMSLVIDSMTVWDREWERAKNRILKT